MPHPLRLVSCWMNLPRHPVRAQRVFDSHHIPRRNSGGEHKLVLAESDQLGHAVHSTLYLETRDELWQEPDVSQKRIGRDNWTILERTRRRSDRERHAHIVSRLLLFLWTERQCHRAAQQVKRPLHFRFKLCK